MPISSVIECPACAAPLVRKPAGRCPACGVAVGDHVQQARAREERIERVVAVIGTALVLGVSLMTAGVGLIEGVLAYACAGVVMFFAAKKTFG